MCAIFGYVSDKPIGKNLEQLLDIGLLNVKRGNQAFGYLGIENYEASSWKGLIVGRRSVQFSMFHSSALESCNIVLFHLLSSTGTEKRIHPFETDQFIFAHNGLLLDYQQGNEVFSYLGPTDSQYLLAAIERVKPMTLMDKISYANEHFQGQRACWLWDKKDQALYLWRVMSPLYIEIGEGQIIFSSVKIADSYTNLPEGKVFGIKNMVLKHLIDFKYYTPYGER